METPDLRNTVFIGLTDEQYEEAKNNANREGISVSEYMLRVAKKMRDESAPTGPRILTEDL